MHAEVTEMFSLRGKVAVITGGSAYLGFDAASILAAAGCAVVVTSRNREAAQAACTRLQQRYGAPTLPLALDHTNWASVRDAATRAVEWQGRIDILINNAGGGSGQSPANLFERDPADIEAMIATNLTGAIYCCREFGRLMAHARRGKIINIASIAALVGRDRRIYEKNGMLGQPVDYAAAKAGIIGLTRDLAGLLGPSGVNVNAISPGGFARGQPGHFESDYSDRTPLGRMGRDGADLKGAILFLASSASDYVHGHNLVVDGGFSIWK